MIKIFLLLLLSIFLHGKNILVLNSYSSTLQWTKEQSETITEPFKDDDNLKFFVEFMNTKVFKLNQSHEKNLYNYYKNKYQNKSFDIVVATDDNALKFIIKYKDELFIQSKVFFSGINNLALAKTLPKDTYAGVFEVKDPVSNLELAKTINQELSTVYLISDDTVTAKKEILHYKSFYDTIKNIKFIYLNHKDIDTISSQLKEYDKNSVVMLLVFTGFEKNNKHISAKKAVEILSKLYENPMLIHTNIYIDLPNSNIVGGNCSCGKTSGKTVSKYMKQYLQGKNMKDIGFSFTDTNQIYINYKNLEKFNIKDSLFKRFNPIEINKRLTFYQQYKLYLNILIASFFIVLFFMFVVIRKNKEINRLNSSLELKITQALNKLEEQHQKHQEENIRNTKFATIGHMAAGITHEINTPLTYIKGTNEMMRYEIEELENGPKKTILLDDNKKLNSGINRIAMIVESMREMSQTMPQKKESINIYSTIITMLRMSYNRSKHLTNIYVNGELFDLENSDKEKQIFITKAQRQRIEQVWTIILNNSFDELVKIYNFDDRKITIDISKEDNKIKVTFQDNAGGIDENIIDKIFEPFSSTKESSGIGIGLNVAKKIVEEHNGVIKAENKNNGACFTVIL